ncbi:hypothetical protein [Pontibacter sp. HJ8]
MYTLAGAVPFTGNTKEKSGLLVRLTFYLYLVRFIFWAWRAGEDPSGFGFVAHT